MASAWVGGVGGAWTVVGEALDAAGAAGVDTLRGGDPFHAASSDALRASSETVLAAAAAFSCCSVIFAKSSAV